MISRMRIQSPLLFYSRVAVAFAFLSFGIWEIIAPNLWILYVPAYASAILDAKLLVFLHGIALVVIALGVLSGYYSKIFTALAALMMLKIVVELILADGWTETLIRDITILLFMVGLLVDAWGATNRNSNL